MVCRSSRLGLACLPAFRPHRPRPSTIRITKQDGDSQRYPLLPSTALLGYLSCYRPSLHDLFLRQFYIRNYTLSFHDSPSSDPAVSHSRQPPFPPDKRTELDLSSRTPITLSRSSTPTVRIHIRLPLLSSPPYPALEYNFRWDRHIVLGLKKNSKGWSLGARV